ncbi:MAG: pullulanase-associated domain-containing protein [Solirubrobacteraceae bacterium]
MTVLAAGLLAVVALDVTAGFDPPHVVGGSGLEHGLHAALGNGAAWIASLGVLDWIIVGIAAALLVCAWMRATSLTALGTMTIDELTVGDDTLDCPAAKALLEQELGRRGLLPPSGVPGGFPSVTSVADAISKAPLPQARWMGALLGLVPLPPSCTSFKITGTLMRPAGEDSGGAGYRFAYRLICVGPVPSVQLGTAEAESPRTAIEHAAQEIYRHVARAAPDMYPPWARWRNTQALQAYREGLWIEQGVAPVSVADAPSVRDEFQVRPDFQSAYRSAHRQYVIACEHDPDNMLARLRAANCLERIASHAEAGSEERRLGQVDALAAYISICVRQPDIFEAGFRASVLMSVLASEKEEDLQAIPLLRASLGQLERSWDRNVDLHDSRGGTLDGRNGRPLKKHLAQVARREAKITQRRLRPMWTLCHENRLRHLFEPSGRDRRQMRKALAMSRLAQRARASQRLTPGDAALAEAWWRTWVYWRYMVGRSELTGWQAHYNAACFYALLSRAGDRSRPARGRRLRRRSLWHLQRAIDKADGALLGAYVRDEDPDLLSLRELSPQRFRQVVRSICADEVTIHYRRPGIAEHWTLHVWGPATKSVNGGGRTTAAAVRCLGTDPREATFRVRILDENRDLMFFAENGGDRDDPGWRLIPAQLPTSEVWVHQGDPRIFNVEEQVRDDVATELLGGATAQPAAAMATGP